MTSEERKVLTFEEAKDQIAKEHGWNGWRGFITGYQVGIGVTFEQMVDEAAELYAESRAKDAWERACDAQISSINDSIKNQWVRDFGKMMDDDAERDGYFICGFVQEALKNNKPLIQ